MSTFLVTKIEPCEQCGGTGQFDGRFSVYKAYIDSGIDPEQAFQEVYWARRDGQGTLERAMQNIDPELVQGGGDGVLTPVLPSDDQLMQLGADTRCDRCNGSGNYRSEVSLADALTELGH